MSKEKSLGIMSYPVAEITSFSGIFGTAEITLRASGKKLKIALGVNCVHTLVRLAQDMTAKQREFAMREWNQYISMKKTTGYTPPAGEQ
jgi:hypothetical protein